MVSYRFYRWKCNDGNELEDMNKNLRISAIIGVLTMASTTACQADSSPNNVEVTNVKSGLMCLYNTASNDKYEYDPRVCFQTEDIQVTGQGRCVFNGENKLCTWYGFEFNYDNKTDAAIPLTCHFNTDENQVHGNPKEVLGKDVTSFEIMLDPGEGHIANPQYTLFRYAPDGHKKININTCEIEGREVFISRFTITIPEAP